MFDSVKSYTGDFKGMLPKQACWRLPFFGLLCCAGIALIAQSTYKLNKTSTVHPLQFQKAPLEVEGLISKLTSQQDERLIRFVQNYLIKKPYDSLNEYKYDKPSFLEVALDTENGNPWDIALELVNDYLPKRPRTFVECGVSDGVYGSWTLYAEKFYNWTGLLIEADPFYFQALSKVSRRAYIANACVGFKTYPYFAKFQHEGEKTEWYQDKKKIESSVNPGRGHIIKEDLGYPIAGTNGEVELLDVSRKAYGYRHRQEMDVLCIPIYTLLKATNLTVIDSFILDFSSEVLGVLATIPFELTEIGVMSIRYAQRAELEITTKFLKSKGYSFVQDFKLPGSGGFGFFIKNEYYKRHKSLNVFANSLRAVL